MNIQTVAERAGVSAATVSYVLNDQARVAAKTRRIVLHAVKELGYQRGQPGRPRKTADAPKSSKRTLRFALLVAGMPRGRLQAPVYVDVLHGVEEAVREHDKCLVLCHLPPGEKCPSRLLPQTVDGIILFGSCPVTWTGFADRLAGIPVVQIMGLIERDEPWDHVTYRNEAIGKLAADYLVERGHRNCATLCPPPEAGGMMAERGEVFRQRLESAGGVVTAFSAEDTVEEGDTRHELKYEAFGQVVDRLLATRPRPTAVFSPADMLTNALHMLLLQRGIQPGRDLEIVSCNNEELLLRNLHPRPAVVDIHAYAVGYRGVEQLAWRLAHPDLPRVSLALEPELIPARP